MQQAVEFKLSQLTLRGIAVGEPDKPMILALHGWLDNAASFLPLTEYLSDYYVVAIDLAGHGVSGHRSAGAHYHLVDFVYDLHELVLQQQWQSFILMGHSLGGIVASLYASCFTEQVSHLICIEALGPMTEAAENSPSQLSQSILSRLQIESTIAKPSKSLERTIQARALVGDLSEASARLLVQRNTRLENGLLTYTTDRRLRAFSSLRMTEEQAQAFLSNITCPTLVITGLEGYQFIAQGLSIRLDWFADVTLVRCQGNHHLHMQHPEVVATAVLDFLPH